MKKKQSKPRFYNRQDRNSHWTEPETGRPIDFADKYLPGDGGSEYGAARQKRGNSEAAKKQRQKVRRRVLAAFLAVVLLCVGYIGADVFIIRHAEPARRALEASQSSANLNELVITAKSLKAESLSLDGAVMLSSVIDEAISGGYTSVTFDAKRPDGTVGYASDLALVDTFGAVSSPAAALKESAETLQENDILPIARVSCWADNIAPAAMPELALKNGDTPVTDGGTAYLDPNNENAYNYIKNIIQECSANGITVFLLTGCDVPGGTEGSGFEALSTRLSEELGTSVKLLHEVDVTITGWSAADNAVNYKGVQAELAALPSLGDNEIYYFSTALSPEVLKPYLDAKLETYILSQET